LEHQARQVLQAQLVLPEQLVQLVQREVVVVARLA
jgi:hypothetical protein